MIDVEEGDGARAIEVATPPRLPEGLPVLPLRESDTSSAATSSRAISTRRRRS